MSWAGAGSEPLSTGDVAADRLTEDGDETEETETISKEEAAERLLVGRVLRTAAAAADRRFQ